MTTAELRETVQRLAHEQGTKLLRFETRYGGSSWATKRLDGTGEIGGPHGPSIYSSLADALRALTPQEDHT